MSAPAFESVGVGDQVAPLRVHLDRVRLMEYAAASGDHNRIHWDDRFAVGVGLSDVIAHGMLTMGAAAQAVSVWAGDAGRIVEYGTKFIAPVPVPYEGGVDLDVTGRVVKVTPQTRRVVLELTVMCAETKVLGRPLATVQLD